MAPAQNLHSLPDAPPPTLAEARGAASPIRQDQSPPAHASRKAASSIEHAPREQRKWARFVDPGEKVVPLYPRDKWKFWVHEEFRWYAAAPEFISAGYGQLADTPDYGSDSGAFGEKLGAAFIRDATMRFFCDSMFPLVTHEDPRYYRKASGGYWSRAGWAAERAFVIQKDDGSHGFNYSNIAGHLAASALTPAYYPPKSANAGMVIQTWTTSIAGSVGNNLLLEFVPDALNAWHRHRQRLHSTGMH
ncbi:MAG: hypothetical protein ACLGXA_20020 [Acidobacteriota bacterium]